MRVEPTLRTNPALVSPSLGARVSGEPGLRWAWRLGVEHPDERLKTINYAESRHLRSAKMARLEAALFVAEGAVAARRLVQAATLADAREVQQLVDRLNQAYDESMTAFRIERVAGGYRLLTRHHLSPWISKLYSRLSEAKISPPALETLAIVAYRQPATRADVETIRGVGCIDMLKHLMDRNLIRIAGEDNSLGRPFLYETTRKFLEMFGLGSLDDLPNAKALRRVMTKPGEEAEDEGSDAVAA